MRALVEGDSRRHRAVVPLWVIDELHEPPAEVVDRVVAKVYARLGMEPPDPSGPNSNAPPPSGRRPLARRLEGEDPVARPAPRLRRWPRALGVLGSAIVAGVAGGFLSGAAFHGCDRRPASEAARVVAVPGPQAIGEDPPAPSAAVSAVQLAPAGLPSVVVADRVVARTPTRARQRAEAVEGDDRRVMQAAGLEEDDPAAALDLLFAVSSANRSPGAVTLLARLCSRLRDPRCR